MTVWFHKACDQRGGTPLVPSSLRPQRAAALVRHGSVPTPPPLAADEGAEEEEAGGTPAGEAPALPGDPKSRAVSRTVSRRHSFCSSASHSLLNMIEALGGGV